MDKKARVVHCKKEPYDVYIGRPSKWGNPFSHKENTKAEYKVDSVEESIESYKKWILDQPKLLMSLHELEGKVLGCWCTPNPCHGDVLAEMVNSGKDYYGESVERRAKDVPDVYSRSLSWRGY